MPSVHEPDAGSVGDAVRVAIDVGPLYGHRTGIGRAVAAMVDHLERDPNVRVERYLISRRATSGPDTLRLPLPGLVATRVWSNSSWPSADRWFGAIDVVHGTNYVAPPTSHPTVISVYDCWFLEHPELASPMVKRAGNWLRRMADSGAWLHCSSAATARAAQALLHTDRTRVIHLGPPPVATVPVSAPPTLGGFGAEIVAVGTEERRKGYPDLVRAFEIIASDEASARLAIAGAPGDDSDELTHAIDSLPPSTRARVHRLGPVSESEKAWLLGQASVLAYPSLDEGFGFPILEANQLGLPVVARAVGSIPEVAGDAALLIPDRVGFVADFAAGIERVLANAAVRDDLISAGKDNPTRFSWDRCAAELAALYRTVAAER